MIQTIKKFNILLDKRQKRNLIYLLIITIIGTAFEVLGISMMIPFTTSLTNPDIINSNQTLSRICAILHITSHKQFVLICIFGFILIFLIKNLFLLFQTYAQARYVYNNKIRTQRELLHVFINRPYEYFLCSSSGEILRNHNTDVNETYRLLMSLISFGSEMFSSIIIVIAIFIASPLMTAIICAMITILIFFIIKVIKPKVKIQGQVLRKYSSAAYKWLVQSVQGIKDIKIRNNENFFEKSYINASIKTNNAGKWQTVYNGIPKQIIEAGSICTVLAVMAFMIILGEPLEKLIPSLAAFAMASIKLLPSANKIVSAVNDIQFSGPCLDNLLENLNPNTYPPQFYKNSKSSKAQFKFTKEIELRDIEYTYPSSPAKVLDHANLSIKLGSCVGIVGRSGAGKTTTVDILLGLLKPQAGQVLVDGVDIGKDYTGWLSCIGYIPQSIFMLDGTIADNVAFGKEFDEAKVWEALTDAQLADFVRSHPDGLNAKIGERGIRLSGGQRQRIGIARALYSNPSLLVFDEATSSLDNETEHAILESINKLLGRKTMIIIAHRLQTIENCDTVYEVKSGQINKTR